ncbi:MAG: PLD nuclease N-terminal domain-containing protein [Opitutales bacterium]|jgi:ABC-type multidrug transport system fused ATPase/permease subunit|nr:PLD nuclease N-terminal domain-containing protein [Opitutales bacterium]MDP4777680.1 PLD nuclease N-terminal domain-containing protein [Opitutales bacterium]
MESTAPNIVITLIPVLFLLIGGVISISFLAFWIWMLVDCLQYEKNEENQKLIWILVIVLTNWIGALIYFFVRRKERKQNESIGMHSSQSAINEPEEV